MTRIASTDQELLQAIRRIRGDLHCKAIAADDLPSSAEIADIFLLPEAAAETAIAAWAECERPTVVAIAREGERVPPIYREGLADDLLVLPLRLLDLERILRSHEQIAAIRGLERTSRAMPDLVRRLQEDIHLAQKIQRRLIREKFPPMGGLTVKSKYWCGLKAGGDYFDVFEFPDQNHVGVILSDSSSYNLSTQFIGSLVEFSVKAGAEMDGDPQRLVQSIYERLRESMKEKDHFTIFYGVLNRKTYQFRFVDCGTARALHRSAESRLAWISEGKSPPLSLAQAEVPPSREVGLEPGDRLVLASDGWEESLGGEMRAAFEGQVNNEDAQALLNELAFRLKKGVERHFGEEEDPEVEFPMPPQDCSILVFDVAKNLLRLAKS